MDNVTIFPDGQALAQAAAEQVVQRAAESIAQRGRFDLVLSGGSTPRAMHQILASEAYSHQVDWSHVHVFWGDERCVPPNHPDSNYRMADETLLSHVPLPAANIHRIRAEQEPHHAADDYDRELKTFFGNSPRFDLLLLGMGDDGHTASLFPGTAALDEKDRWVVANYVEKLGVWRITLTAPAINAAVEIVFLVSGYNKAESLQHVLDGPHEPHKLPSQLINPEQGELRWFVDEAAASRL
jgi:6-phosphogluconolactonase